MKKLQIKTVMVFDQMEAGSEHPAFFQLMTKAKELFAGEDVRFIRAGMALPGYTAGTEDDISRELENPEIVTAFLERAVAAYEPDILLLAATTLGEEVAPALGVRLGTGVAAHCLDIRETEEGRIAYIITAFGGRSVGEIFIPGGKPAIATINPGVFDGDRERAGSFEELDPAVLSQQPGAEEDRSQFAEPHFKLTGREQAERSADAIEKAALVFCGGFGIGSEENWQKIKTLAERTGGGAGCTRPVIDMGWGPDEYAMIGTSGKTVRPKVYIGFGISGASHHLCGIKDAGIIININNDRQAEVFAASDHMGVSDAGAVLDSLLGKL
ncbi:MAG: electron transfer flavoprotein subunit alpha/FixB family protein [Bacillota bacterium]|nr:electron transfer flavoprotein subunit alpha/FixB family protein [Bacillota bacterium]